MTDADIEFTGTTAGNSREIVASGTKGSISGHVRVSRLVTVLSLFAVCACIGSTTAEAQTTAHSQSGQGKAAEHQTRKSTFSVMKGKGTPVCDDYANLLNRTHFEVTSFCGRPDDDPAHGFAHLERRYLSADEIFLLFNRVDAFMKFSDQDLADRPPRPSPQHPHRVVYQKAVTSVEEVRQILSLNYLKVWTYSVPIDIQNNGTPIRVLMWQGYGVTDKGAPCGDSPASKPWSFPYMEQRAFVLTDDGAELDERRTRAIFGAQAGLGPSQRGVIDLMGAAPAPGERPFAPLADSVGIFEYAGRYYIHTENIPVSSTAAAPIRILLNEHSKTRLICEIR